jgi:2-methylcitrate dehydratase PrpD
MSGLTAALAAFVHQPGFPAQLPEAAVSIIKTGFADTLATMIAGRDEPVVQIARRFVAARHPAPGASSVLLGKERLNAADAALINGAAGHALDFDDVALGGHPSTVLVPAVLAAAEEVNASGAEALRAYLVGYEVWAELFTREKDAYHLKGWHPTAVLGTVGACAAAAYLFRLPLEQIQHALALSASMASGLVANCGTMTKPLHAGRAAACGLEAVQFARLGLTAAPDAFEHHAGYLAALSPQGQADRASPCTQLGKTLRILDYGLSIKKYPTCYATHRVIDGVLDLRREHGVKPDRVKAIRARIGVAQASMLRNHSPVTGLEAKFSLEFAIASALVHGRVGLSELTDPVVSEQPIRELMTRVAISTEDTHCTIEPIFALNDRVELVLDDDRVLDTGDIRFARGNAKLVLSQQDMRTKFMDCTQSQPQLDREALWQQLSNLEQVPSTRELASA